MLVITPATCGWSVAPVSQEWTSTSSNYEQVLCTFGPHQDPNVLRKQSRRSALADTDRKRKDCEITGLDRMTSEKGKWFAFEPARLFSTFWILLEDEPVSALPTGD